mmetsp:Transcript_19860/g.76099  ORF Transcript_19860/g.76099 Transcript_19860/m.76099 type:complete len:225 (-) Transcript_19860:599-1273(-)
MQPPRRRAARSSPGCASSWQSRDVSNASTQRSRRPQASPECARIPERHFSRPSPRPGPRPARAQGRQGPPAPAPRPPLASPPPAHSPGSTTVSTRRMAPSGEPALTCWAVLNDSAASRFHSSPALTYERPSRYQVSESSLLTSVMFSKICALVSPALCLWCAAAHLHSPLRLARLEHELGGGLLHVERRPFRLVWHLSAGRLNRPAQAAGRAAHLRGPSTSRGS